MVDFTRGEIREEIDKIIKGHILGASGGEISGASGNILAIPFIAAAVNACQKVNPDNPQAVAEALQEMYEALKKAKKLLENDDRSWAEAIVYELITKALAKAEGKGE